MDTEPPVTGRYPDYQEQQYNSQFTGSNNQINHSSMNPLISKLTQEEPNFMGSNYSQNNDPTAAYAAQHGLNYNQFQSQRDSHSLPPNFRHQRMLNCLPNNNNKQQGPPTHQHNLHRRSNSHGLTSSQNFNHNPLPNRYKKLQIKSSK